MSTLRDRLTLTIQAARVPVSVVARAADVPDQTLRKLLHGVHTHVLSDTLVKLADALGCTTDWLLGRSSQGPTPVSVRYALALTGAKIDRKLRVPPPRAKKIPSRSVMAPQKPEDFVEAPEAEESPAQEDGDADDA
jgi:hypothetical protein